MTDMTNLINIKNKQKFLHLINPLSSDDENIPVVFYVIKKILAFFIIRIISMLIAEFLAIIVHFIMGLNPLKGELFDIQTMQLIKYYGFIVFIIISILYCVFVEKRSIKSMGFRGNIVSYLKGVLISIILLILSIAIIFFTGQISFNGIVKNMNLPILIAFLIGFIIQGTMEETLCRGFLMTSLLKRVSIPTAIIISSLAFTYPHLSSLFSGGLIYGIVGVINILIMSTIFSLYMINEGNIWISCAIHSFWNFCLFNVFGLNLSGSESVPAIFNFTTNSENIINGGKYGIEASIITTIVLSICLALLILKTKKKYN